MARLDEIARVVRSKNAGPRKQTFDLMFGTEEDYRHAQSRLAELHRAAAARLGVAPDALAVIDYPPARAIKLVLTRAVMAGDPGDRDVYGAQQHAPLLDIAL